MKEIYFTSDFSIKEQNGDFTKPFRFRYFASDGLIPYIVDFDGETYTNCKLDEKGGLVVFFKGHKMGCGKLMCEKSYLKTNEDGTCTWVKANIKEYDIILVAVPVAIKAEEVGNGGVNLNNVDAKIVKQGKSKAVLLQGDYNLNINKETGEIKLY